MPEEIIYRGDTEEERIESAVTYTSLMNLVERFRAGQVYCTSQELAAFIKCLDVAIPYWIEIPQPPVMMPEGAPMAPVPMAPVTAPAGAPVAPVPSGQQQNPPDPAGSKGPRRIRQVP